MKKYVYCYNKRDFDSICNVNDWSDDNPPSPEKHTALISICSTPDVVQNIICSPDNHFFERDHRNVLNLDFDDVSKKEEDINGGKAYGITKEQALKVVKFIRDRMDDCWYFFIHCRAGQSRSQAIVRYILDTYRRIYEIIIRPDNPPTTPNPYVLSQLKQAEKVALEETRINFIEEGYTVESFIADIYGGNWAVIKLKGMDTEIYYWPNNSTTHVGKWMWGKDGDVHEADDYTFWTEIRKYVKN